MPIELSIINPHLYYSNDFDEFYVYDEENISNKFRRLEILSQDTITLGAGQEHRIDCVYNTRECETFRDYIEFKVKEGETHKIEVFAEVQDIHIALSKTNFSLS